MIEVKVKEPTVTRSGRPQLSDETREVVSLFAKDRVAFSNRMKLWTKQNGWIRGQGGIVYGIVHVKPYASVEGCSGYDFEAVSKDCRVISGSMVQMDANI